jgi:diaminopimelate decarboxylase
VQDEGLGLDVCSAGELELAVTTGFPPRHGGRARGNRATSRSCATSSRPAAPSPTCR